ncbi:MAG TPA: hypothetical protein VJ483_10015 [Holophagaceae bacterium]|nr:hypothetical protein [Holophagaceae bacterium]
MSLRHGTYSERAFASAVLVVLGLGFALAFVYLYANEIRPHQMQGHSLVQGVSRTYYGERTTTRLENVLQGTMADQVSKDELKAIKDWVKGGATKEGFATIEPIITNNCASCHGEGGQSPRLVKYEDVHPLAQYDTGVALKTLARMSHVHLLAIPILLFMMGSLFVRTRYRERLKAFFLVLPFFGVVWDIAHWWITKRYESAALGIIMGGAMMGIGFGGQWLLTAMVLWLPTPVLNKLQFMKLEEPEHHDRAEDMSGDGEGQE